MNRTRLTRCCALVVYATPCAFVLPPVRAERLPIQTLTSADGLAGDRVGGRLSRRRLELNYRLQIGNPQTLVSFPGDRRIGKRHRLRFAVSGEFAGLVALRP